MKALVVYFSMRGHTRKAAKAIASELGEGAALVELAYRGKFTDFAQDMAAIGEGDLSKFDFDRAALDLAPFDLVLFGTPVYGGKPSPAFNAFVKNCKNGQGKRWVLFATYGVAAKNLFGLMKPEVEKTGGSVAGEAKFSSMLGVSERKAREFARRFES